MQVLIRLSWGWERISLKEVSSCYAFGMYIPWKESGTQVAVYCEFVITFCGKYTAHSTQHTAHSYPHPPVRVWRLLEFGEAALGYNLPNLYFVNLASKALSEIVPTRIRPTLCGTPTAAWNVCPTWSRFKFIDGTNYFSSIFRTSKN